LQLDPGAVPTTVGSVQLQAGAPTFSIMTQPGLSYFVEYTDDLVNPAWFTLSGALGNGSVNMQTDFLTSGVAQRF